MEPASIAAEQPAVAFCDYISKQSIVNDYKEAVYEEDRYPPFGFVLHRTMKRPMPIAVCTVCGNAGYNPSLTNRRCGKNINEKRCEGTNLSAVGAGEWNECAFCQGIGVERNALCSRCRGVGWQFAGTVG